MAKIELSENQKKLDIDLWIIMIVSFKKKFTES